MAKNAHGFKTYPAPIGVFVERMRALPWSGLKIQLDYEQPIQDGLKFIASTRPTFTSWGENINVTLIDQGYQTYVDVYSEGVLPTQIVDMGKNQNNVDKIFSYLDQVMMR